MELANINGYLLQYFVVRSIRAIGVVTAANIAGVAEKNGVPTALRLFDVKELPTHGGSLCIYGRHTGADAVSDRVVNMRKYELNTVYDRVDTYRNFGEQARKRNASCWNSRSELCAMANRLSVTERLGNSWRYSH